jgi:hypothetical protein
MTDLEQAIAAGAQAGCPLDQMRNFLSTGVVLQARQLVASAAARMCDRPEGPTAIGYGGARGGGKPPVLMRRCVRPLWVSVTRSTSGGNSHSYHSCDSYDIYDTDSIKRSRCFVNRPEHPGPDGYQGPGARLDGTMAATGFPQTVETVPNSRARPSTGLKPPVLMRSCVRPLWDYLLIHFVDAEM